jgi:hypothetical protein
MLIDSGEGFEQADYFFPDFETFYFKMIYISFPRLTCQTSVRNVCMAVKGSDTGSKTITNCVDLWRFISPRLPPSLWHQNLEHCKKRCTILLEVDFPDCFCCTTKQHVTKDCQKIISSTVNALPQHQLITNKMHTTRQCTWNLRTVSVSTQDNERELVRYAGRLIYWV